MGARNSLGGEIARLVTNNGKTLEGGGGPPHDPDMERRVAALEAKVDGIKDTLSAIQVTLATIQAGMASKADVAAVEKHVAVLDERTKSLATTKSMATMLGLGTAAIALIAKWADVVHYFTGH